MSSPETLSLLLRELRLSTISKILEETINAAHNKKWSHEKFLAVLCEAETAARYSKRIQRYIKDSKLPAGKSLATFDFKAAKTVDKAHILALAENSSWLEKAENLILFGPSGVGKSHIAAAIGHSLVDQGIRCLFTPTTNLVQQLQLARKEYRLPDAMHKLDKYALLILDDIGYAKKDESETNVLFELISHRYETGSIIITANQPFSDWDKVFPDSMMAVAAIDRLVHHATIINIQDESYRKKTAGRKKRG